MKSKYLYESWKTKVTCYHSVKTSGKISQELQLLPVGTLKTVTQGSGKDIRFGFYDISTIGGYSMPNPLYTRILDIQDLVWFGFMTYQPLRLYNAKSFVFIYNKYMIWFGWVGFYGI